MTTPLRTVDALDEVFTSLENFATVAPHLLDPFEQKVLSEFFSNTTYWVYDEDTRMFGPAKFVGFADMTFERYAHERKVHPNGGAFNGGDTHQAIAQVFGRNFLPDPELVERLEAFLVEVTDRFSFEHREDWRFLRVRRPQRAWALQANPAQVNEEPVRLLLPVVGLHVRAQDALLVWDATAPARRRSVLGMGVVLAVATQMPDPPAPVPDASIQQQFARLAVWNDAPPLLAITMMFVPLPAPLVVSTDVPALEVLARLPAFRYAAGDAPLHEIPAHTWDAVRAAVERATAPDVEGRPHAHRAGALQRADATGPSSTPAPQTQPAPPAPFGTAMAQALLQKQAAPKPPSPSPVVAAPAPAATLVDTPAAADAPTTGASPDASRQGIRLDHADRVAIERHAMHVVHEDLRARGFAVQDTSASCPYDFVATRGAERLFVEVKGSTTTADSVMLTHGEVEHARQHAGACALAVVSHIQLQHPPTGAVGTAGSLAWFWDWQPLPADLVPVQYRYTLPRGA